MTANLHIGTGARTCRLHAVTRTHHFGSARLTDYLEHHGAIVEELPFMAVPAQALRDALADPEAAGLDADDQSPTLRRVYGLTPRMIEELDP
jgi:hypothetical protein